MKYFTALFLALPLMAQLPISVSGGGGGAGTSTTRVLIPGVTAVCQSGITPGVAGSTPASNAVTAVCEADGLSGFIQATYNTGTGYFYYQRVDLPQDWLGTLKLNIAGWSSSTNATHVKVQTGCVGITSVTTGVTFNTAQDFTLTPNATSFRAVLAAQSLTTTGCAAGNELQVKYNIVGESGGTALNIRSLQVTE